MFFMLRNFLFWRDFFFRSADFFQNQTLIIFKELDVSENAVGVSGSSALFAMLAENTTVEKLGNKASLKINAKWIFMKLHESFG